MQDSVLIICRSKLLMIYTAKAVICHGHTRPQAGKSQQVHQQKEIVLDDLFFATNSVLGGGINPTALDEIALR